MKRLIVALLFVCSAWGQNARFPSQIATDSDLKVWRNFIATQLRYSVSAAQSQIQVHDASRIVPGLLLTIEREIVSVDQVSGNILTVTRGFDGTAAAAHLAGRQVASFPTAWDKNAIAAEVKAIEEALGVGLANLSTPAGGIL